jgi:hypothetical protein
MALGRQWAISALLLATASADAQTTLGALVDAGGERLSPKQFREEVVQRQLNGPLASGFNLQFVYTSRGSLEGAGSGGAASFGAEWAADVRGTWKFGDNGTVCTSVVLDGPTIRANFPPRCQYWYRLRDRFYVAESDTDRRARVLPRSQVE